MRFFDTNAIASTAACNKSRVGTSVIVYYMSKTFQFQCTLKLECLLCDCCYFICVSSNSVGLSGAQLNFVQMKILRIICEWPLPVVSNNDVLQLQGLCLYWRFLCVSIMVFSMNTTYYGIMYTAAIKVEQQ